MSIVDSIQSVENPTGVIGGGYIRTSAFSLGAPLPECVL